MKKLHVIKALPFLCLSTMLNAQQDSAASKPQFKLGLFYNSGLNYYGRVDSLKSSGFFPLAELWLNKQLYITAAPVFVSNAANNFAYAGTVVTAGHMFRHTHWAGNNYILKPIYRDNSGLVQSALKLQAVSSFSWLNKVANINFGGDIKFSDKLDFGVQAGLDHLFRFEPGKNTVLVIDPSAYVYAGTRQFTRTYYKQQDFLIFPGVNEQITEDVKSFDLLSFEFSAPVVLAKGKFQFILNPAFVLPQNLVVVPGKPDLSERGDNLFYATAGMKVIL